MSLIKTKPKIQYYLHPLVCTAQQCSRGGLKALGKQKVTSGHWSHFLQTSMTSVRGEEATRWLQIQKLINFRNKNKIIVEGKTQKDHQTEIKSFLQRVNKIKIQYVQHGYELFYKNQISLKRIESISNMSINHKEKIQMENQLMEIKMSVMIPKQALNGNQVFEVCLKPKHQGHQPIAKSQNSYILLNKKFKVQQLFQDRSRKTLIQKDDYQDRYVHTERSFIRTSNMVSSNRTNDHQSCHREERERTRQIQKHLKRQEQRQGKQISSSLANLLRQAVKVHFQPKFNISDNIYAIYNNTFSIRSSNHPGFMIVNDHFCKPNKVSEIKFETIIENLNTFADECDLSDCGIGITYCPQDLLNKNKKNPVDRCMAYYFGCQKMRIQGETQRVPIESNNEKIYRLIIDIPNRSFVLVANKAKRIVVKRTIPIDFFQQSVFFFLELKNSGKIKIL